MQALIGSVATDSKCLQKKKKYTCIYIYSTEQLYCFRYSDIQVLQQQNIGTHPLGYALP